MKDVPKIFVIIVAYKGKRWYDRCFFSLRESTVPIKIIVVDNASSDGSSEYIRERYPDIHLIVSPENLGFGRANNIGMRYALENGCDYVFLLNQDTWIEPDAIEKLVAIHKQHQEYGILSPMHLRADRKSLYMQIIDGNNNNPNKELISDLYCHTLQEVYTVKYVNAAAWLLPRNTMEVVGGFDPIFFVYGEDGNYLNRLEYHKLKLGLVPQSQIVHDHQTDSGMSGFSRSYHREQFMLVYYTNILEKFSIGSFMRYKIRKMIIAFLKGDKKGRIVHKEDFAYLRKHRMEIEKSRKTNMQKGVSWLY